MVPMRMHGGVMVLHVVRRGPKGPHAVPAGPWAHRGRAAHRIGELLRHLREGGDGIEGGGCRAHGTVRALVGVNGDVVRPVHTARAGEWSG